MTAAHQRARHGHDRQIMRQALQQRVAAGPAEAVEEDIGLADRGDEAGLVEAGQHHDMLLRVQPLRGKDFGEALKQQVGDLVAAAIADEGKLAVRHLARDARKDLVVLRQVFVHRLPAPIDHRIVAQAELGAAHRGGCRRRVGS